MSDQEYHWVKRGKTIYLRRRPFTYDNPAPAQRKVRASFGLAAYRARDEFDTVEVQPKDGRVKEVVKLAARVMEELTTLKVAPPKPVIIYKYMALDLKQLAALVEALALLTK